MRTESHSSLTTYITTTLADAMIADPDWAIGLLQQYKAEKIAKEEAIRTKAEIGSRREATAMVTAKIALDKADKLSAEVGAHRQCATVVKVESVTGRKFAWAPLKRYCLANELEFKKVIGHSVYGCVNTYPAEAWWAVYEIDLGEFFPRK